MPTTIVPGDFWYILPEIVLTAWGLGVLILDFAFLRHTTAPRRQRGLGLATLAGCFATVVSVLWPYFAPFYGGGTEGFAAAPPTATASPTNAEASVANSPRVRDVAREIALPDDLDPQVFGGTIAADAATERLNLLVIGLLALVVGMSLTWPFTAHWGEYYALLMWSAVGMMLLIAAEELLTLFLTLEMMTLCLYLATAFDSSRRRSAEGALKYFVYGSVSSAMFLFGLSLIYGLTGTTRIDGIAKALTGEAGLGGNVAGAVAVLLVMVGFGFKIAAVPFHQWAPDTYEGAPAPVAAWIASGSKVASFVALIKVLVHGLGPWAHQGNLLDSPGWIYPVAIIAGASMTFGNLAALAQRNLKRMLAYSSIAHAGYMLVGVLAATTSRDEEAAGAVLFYLVIYALTTVGAFALAAWIMRDKDRDDLEDLNGLGRQSPGLAVCIVLMMLSLIGMPPLAGFFGKLYMFMEALNSEGPGLPALTWLVALGLINSVVSAFYYVRVLKAMFLRPPARAAAPAVPGSVRWPIIVGTLAAVGFGVYPTPLLDSMKGAAIPMLSAGGRAPGLSRYATEADPNFKPDPEALKRMIEENSKKLQGAGPG